MHCNASWYFEPQTELTVSRHHNDTVGNIGGFAYRRMYNQRGESKNGPIPESPSSISKKAGGKLYKNPWDCLVQTVRAEGPLAVYKVAADEGHSKFRDFLRIY